MVLVPFGCIPQPPLDPPGPVELPSVEVLRERVQTYQCDSQEFRDLADMMVLASREGVAGGPHGVPGPMPPEARFLISTANLNNNQVHDCQRLIGPNDTAGTRMAEKPLVAVLPSADRVQNGAFFDGVVVADIINYDSVAYGPLGIPPGLSCLWVEAGVDADLMPGANGGPPHGGTLASSAERSSQTVKWTAAIRVPLNGSCSDPDFQAGLGKALDVERRQVHVLPEELSGPEVDRDRLRDRLGEFRLATVDDYPHVGRWMWDPESGTQFIGIQCGDGWCEIGAPEFEASREPISFVDEIPGWSDGQFLSVRTPTGDLVLSGLYGSITPGADNEVAESQRVQSWSCSSSAPEYHVATLRFRELLGPDPTDAWDVYARKLGLEHTQPESAHRLFFRTGRRFSFPFCKPSYLARTETGSWMSATRCDVTHSGSGTVRWAWDDEDEGVWFPCLEGCCMARGQD
jgi:hypothetical protein